jgi:hypothetical protein
MWLDKAIIDIANVQSEVSNVPLCQGIFQHRPPDVPIGVVRDDDPTIAACGGRSEERGRQSEIRDNRAGDTSLLRVQRAAWFTQKPKRKSTAMLGNLAIVFLVNRVDKHGRLSQPLTVGRDLCKRQGLRRCVVKCALAIHNDDIGLPNGVQDLIILTPIDVNRAGCRKANSKLFGQVKDLTHDDAASNVKFGRRIVDQNRGFHWRYLARQRVIDRIGMATSAADAQQSVVFRAAYAM